MRKSLKISIIIVNYNVKDFLLQCLRSIENSKFDGEIETIVVDNNSTDGSTEFLKPLFPNVSFIELEENLGFAKANNIGIKKASGKYALILNPDAILERDTLQIMSDYMESHPEVSCAGCKVLNPDGTFQLACRRGFPTPWASFSKLFGLQKLFPKTKLFASYNQTFRDENETYYIDAIMGAFMFCRREALLKVGGFDEDFFMYGEDLDLCYRLWQSGGKIAYVSETSIIHYKGESSKRSSIDQVKRFYEAMEIFAKKHYSRSSLFLAFIKLGIFLRSIIAKANKRKKEIIVILWDLISINLALIISSYYRFGSPFAFPDYAYPTVFVAVSLVLIFSMFSVGEYFETKPTIRRALFGLMVAFFILSSLTYYFKQFAFSRGVALATIGLTAISAAFIRAALALLEKTKGSQSDRRIAFIGVNDKTNKIIEALNDSGARNINIVGIIAAGDEKNVSSDYPIIGNAERLPQIIQARKIDEIIITDSELARKKFVKLAESASNFQTRFHIAEEYEELLASRIASEISGKTFDEPVLNIDKLRNRLLKRAVDIALSLTLLTVLLPISLVFFKNRIGDFIEILKGKRSFIGVYPIKEDVSKAGKPGLLGLAHISKPSSLSPKAIKKLNDYYRQNYSFSLDLDIVLKSLFRKKENGQIRS